MHLPKVGKITFKNEYAEIILKCIYLLLKMNKIKLSKFEVIRKKLKFEVIILIRKKKFRNLIRCLRIFIKRI